MTLLPASTVVPARRAFTLVEMAVSIAVLGVVVAAVASSIRLTVAAIPDPASDAELRETGRRLAARIAGELATAVGTWRVGAADLEFTVADRDDDGEAERIRYTWAGTPGAPIRRWYNAVPVDLAPAWDFAITFDTPSRTESVPAVVTDAEVLLASYVGPASTEYRIESANWCAQLAQPRLPATAQSWEVTRVRVWLEKEGSPDGQISVQLRTVGSNGLPSSIIVAERPLAESTFGSSFAWQQVSFTGVAGRPPGSGLWIVLRHVSNTPSGVTETIDSKVANARAMAAVTSNSGSTWTAAPEGSLRYEVHGRVTRVTTTSGAVSRAEAATVRIALGPRAASGVSAATPVPARPELMSWIDEGYYP